MVRHIVFFRLSPTVGPEIKALQLKEMDEIFSSLGKKLGYAVEYRTGINFSRADHSWDFVIDSLFTNREDLQKYQVSPEHTEAIKRGSKIEKTKAVIDYEF